MGGGKGGSSSHSFVIGYRLFVGMHMICCHGPVTAIRQINSGNIPIWPLDIVEEEEEEGGGEDNVWGDEETPITYELNRGTKLTSSGNIAISVEEVFGGDGIEGGVSGNVSVEFGGSGQSGNAYLAEVIGEDVPGHRGVLGFVLEQVYVGNNPYIRPWSFLIENLNTSGNWSPGNRSISYQYEGGTYYDMNPAHIIRECLINPHWGMGYPSEEIDNDSFTSAASTLYSENFGLSFMWDQSGEIEEFIMDVLRHIDAMLYVDITTGLFKLKLIRKDYNVDSLDELNPDNIIEIKSYDKKMDTELVNTVTINYISGATNQDTAITVHSNALIFSQQGVVGVDIKFYGISNEATASAVAARELRIYSSELSKVVLIGNRECSKFQIGDVFKLNWPAYGIATEIFRIAKVTYGGLMDGAVEIEAIQDVDSLGHVEYANIAVSPHTKWKDPVSYPLTPERTVAFEAPYWMINTTASNSELFMDRIEPESSYVAYAVAKPTQDSMNYSLYTKEEVEEEYGVRSSKKFTTAAIINEPVNKTDTTLSYAAISSTPTKVNNTLALIDDEFVKIESIDYTNKEITIDRGMLDTVPEEHSPDSAIYFVGLSVATDYVEYVEGETVNLRALPRTGKGTLSFSASRVDSVTMNRRQIRPYPPGKFRINTILYPECIGDDEDITISWTHRDRLQQTAYLVSQDEENIGPEEGTTYIINIYGDDDVLMRTIDSLTANDFVYTREMEKEDLDMGDELNKYLTVELYSLRDGYESWSRHKHTFSRPKSINIQSSSQLQQSNEFDLFD